MRRYSRPEPLPMDTWTKTLTIQMETSAYCARTYAQAIRPYNPELYSSLAYRDACAAAHIANIILEHNANRY